jgi:hypothetical protein
MVRRRTRENRGRGARGARRGRAPERRAGVRRSPPRASGCWRRELAGHGVSVIVTWLGSRSWRSRSSVGRTRSPARTSIASTLSQRSQGAGPAARTLFAWAHRLVRRNTLAAFGLSAGVLATGPVKRVYTSKPPPALARRAPRAPGEPGSVVSEASTRLSSSAGVGRTPGSDPGVRQRYASSTGLLRRCSGLAHPVRGRDRC